MYYELLYPVLSKHGYFPFRSDHIYRPGIIHNQIIDAIIESPLVIADLSFHKPNVFYELSNRHAIAKPILQIIRKNDDLPFDINPIRTLIIDIDQVKEKILEFENMVIEATKDEISWENPIHMALSTRNIRLNPIFNDDDIVVRFAGYESSEIVLPIINMDNLPSDREVERINKRIVTIQPS